MSAIVAVVSGWIAGKRKRKREAGMTECTCGFHAFESTNAHHPSCLYRIREQQELLDNLIDEVGEAGGIRYERR